MNKMTYLKGHKNVRKSLPICVMEMNSKFLFGHNINNFFQHSNNSSCTERHATLKNTITLADSPHKTQLINN